MISFNFRSSHKKQINSLLNFCLWDHKVLHMKSTCDLFKVSHYYYQIQTLVKLLYSCKTGSEWSMYGINLPKNLFVSHKWSMIP